MSVGIAEVGAVWLLRFFCPERTRSPVPLAADAARVFRAAVRIARRHKQEYISTWHLLLGLRTAGPDHIQDLFDRAGITSDVIYQRCDFLRVAGGVIGALPLTPTALHVMEAAWETARHAGGDGVDALTMLRAMAEEKEGVVSGLLARLNPDG
jgi:ATP-dependent Clp protease ATP-binding subunit ClpA